MNELRPCRFRRIIRLESGLGDFEWVPGFFHQWAVDGGYDEGIETYAIVEDKSGEIHCPAPKWITFNITEEKNES